MKTVLTVCLLAASAGAEAKAVRELSSQGEADWAALVARTPRAELGALLQATSVDDLLARGRRTLQGFGVYGARLTKRERVRGDLLPAQVLDLVVRDQPLAARVVFAEGPAKGRKLLYNAELRKDEMRVREAGPLGLFAIWLSLDSGMARRDTNRSVTDLGFAALLRLLQGDLDRARPHGGFARTDEGFDAQGAYCLRFAAPAGATGLAGDRSRICIDPLLGLPVKSEVWRKGELFESYAFEQIRPRLQVDSDYFTPEAAGL